MTSSNASQSTVRAWAWQCQECARECVPIRAESRCMCGHRLKEHTDGHRCSNRSCSCPQFSFIVAEGSWMLRCRCKHKHTEHDPATHSCKKAACSCGGFYSPWVCNCNHPWAEHQQIMVERQVLRLEDMIAQAQQTASSVDVHSPNQASSSQTAEQADAEAAEDITTTGAAAAAGAAAGQPSSKPSSNTARLQQLRCLRKQRQQHLEGQDTALVAAITASSGHGMLEQRSAAAAGGGIGSDAVSSDVLLAEGDLTCEVNRWDLLQRGKQ